MATRRWSCWISAGSGEVVACDQYQGGLLDMSGGHDCTRSIWRWVRPRLSSPWAAPFARAVSRCARLSAAPILWYAPQGKVRAKFIIVAGNAYLGNLVPELASKSMPCGTQVIYRASG